MVVKATVAQSMGEVQGVGYVTNTWNYRYAYINDIFDHLGFIVSLGSNCSKNKLLQYIYIYS